MINHYFLGALLPDLYVDEQPQLGWKEYEVLLSENLSSSRCAEMLSARDLLLSSSLCTAERHQQVSGIFETYLTMDRELRLILAVLRAKRLGRDIACDVQGEEDPLVAQILSQKDAMTYEPPEQYAQVVTIFNEYDSRPLHLYRALLEFRLCKIDEWMGIELFSSDRLWAYLIKLVLIEQWQRLDPDEGLKKIDEMIKSSKEVVQ